MRKVLLIVLLVTFCAEAQDSYLLHRRKAFRPAAAGGGGGDAAYRSSSDVRGTDLNATVTEPTGAAANDIFIAVAHCAVAGTLTAPAGWSVITNGTQGFDALYDYNVAWIRRGASAPSLTWTTGTSQYREVFVHAFSGAISSGDAIDVHAKANASTGNEDPPSVTTTANNSLVFIAAINYGGSIGWVAPANYTLRGNTTAGNNTINASRTSLVSPAGAENPAVFTGGPGAGNAWEAFTIAIKD